jgi:hypothetical protein
LFRSIRGRAGLNTIAPHIPIEFAQAILRLAHRYLPNKIHRQLGVLAKLDDKTIHMATRGSIRPTQYWREATGVRPSSLVDAYAAYLDGPETYHAYVHELRTSKAGQTLRFIRDYLQEGA